MSLMFKREGGKPFLVDIDVYIQSKTILAF